MSSTVSSGELLASLREFSAQGDKPDPNRESGIAPSEPPSTTLDDGLSIAQIEALVARKIDGATETANRIVDLLCMVAKADGRVDEAEQNALAKVLGVLLGAHLHEAVVKHLIRGSLREIAADGIDRRMATIVAVLVPAQLVEEALALGAAIALVSDGLSAPERAVLKMYADRAGISSERFGAIIRSIGRELQANR